MRRPWPAVLTFVALAGLVAWLLSPGDPATRRPLEAPATGAEGSVPQPPFTAPPPPPPTSTHEAALTPLELALLKVEEVRGSSGSVQVPSALRHESDNRRFLAVQIAHATDNGLALPHDSAALAELILRGELVEIPVLGEHHVLYEVGEDARDDPLSHYDEETGGDIPLYSPEEWARRKGELRAAGEGSGRAASEARADLDYFSSYYEDPARRERLFRERAAVRRLAADFGGVRYELSDPAHKRAFGRRMLGFVRPEARDAILELARSYHAAFDRPLPLSSLVRTHRYQSRLGRVNRNATNVDVPPHTTGLAFDVSYKYMPPAEQNFVMERIAEMEEQGRVEALRERRNHIHVYALGSGGPPADTRVADFLAEVEAARSRPRGGGSPRRSGR